MDKSCILILNEIIKFLFKFNGIGFDCGGFILLLIDGLFWYVDESGFVFYIVLVIKGYVYGFCFYLRCIIYFYYVDKGKVYVLFDDKLGI